MDIENEKGGCVGIRPSPCVKEGAFKEFKNQMKMDIEYEPLIITTYSTASKCLGSMVEYFFRHQQQNKIDECFLIIDEAHLLLQNSSLIETIRDFKNVGLLTATPDDIRNFLVFSDFKFIKPKTTITYDRTIFIHHMETKSDEILNQVALKVDDILSQSSTEQSHICLVKVEDKAFCKKLKDKLNYKYNVYLYNSDTKEVLIDDNGKFKINDEILPANDDIQIVISTSCIQAGQSLKEENLTSLFVQTPLDIVSNVQQFIGRNRCPQSQAHLYLRISKDNKAKTFKFDHGNNRYKTKFNKLKACAWNYSTIEEWQSKLKDYGKIICDEELFKESKDNEKITIKAEETEFSSKKELYKHYGIKSLKYIPADYEISQRWVNKNGERTRKYKLVMKSTISC